MNILRLLITGALSAEKNTTLRKNLFITKFRTIIFVGFVERTSRAVLI